MTGDLLLAITTNNSGLVFIEDADGRVLSTVDVSDDETEAESRGKVLRGVYEAWNEKFSE